MQLKTKSRQCPECGGKQFEAYACTENRSKIGGNTRKCLSCGWTGFALQLVVAPEANTAKAFAQRHNAELV